PDAGRVQPGALRGDHDRQPLARTLFDLVQRLDRGCRVVPVDEDGVEHLAKRAHDRVAFEFLLADGNPVVADQRTDDDGVGLVAVVEDEHRGPLCGQGLFAENVELNTAGGQQHLRPRCREEVDPRRLLRVNSPIPRAPAATGTTEPTPASVRSWAVIPPPLRLVNRRIGQPRRLATAAILPSGLVGRGLPTRYISATSSSPSA